MLLDVIIMLVIFFVVGAFAYVFCRVASDADDRMDEALRKQQNENWTDICPTPGVTYSMTCDWRESTEFIFLDEDDRESLEVVKKILNLPPETSAVRIDQIDIQYFVEE